MNKITQAISSVFLILLISAACYGAVLAMKEDRPEEVAGVVQKKFHNHVVANTLSNFELKTQYWIKLKDGRTVQLPVYLYHKVNNGEKISLYKPNGSPLFYLQKSTRN